MSILCLNCGYANTKVKTQNEEFLFPSKIRKAIDDYETNTVTIDGIKYVCGEGMNDLSLDKTNSIVQKACTKLAIKKSKLKECDIIACLPVSTYRNKEFRKEYENMLLEFPETKSVHIFMEGMAVVLQNLNFFNNKLVCLADFGGNTVNIMLIDNKKLITDSCFSINLGSIIILNKIRKAIEQSTLQIVPEYQIPYLKDTVQYQSVVRDFIDEIKQELKKKQYPTDNIEYCFTGGGALLFRDYLKKYFPNCYISDDAIWENVRGLYNFGEVMLNES